MLEISPVSLPLQSAGAGTSDTSYLITAASRALSISREDIADAILLRRSVDARKKHDVHFVATLAVKLFSKSQEEQLLLDAERRGGFASQKGVRLSSHRCFEPLDIPSAGQFAKSPSFIRPLVVGTGPAGLFCALVLAQAGLKPLVVERGADVDERMRAIQRFSEGGPLDVQTNVQFGEGGAGTFSDGKLTTGTKSTWARQVLHWFVEAGAPEEILWQAKPHIGTDLLVGVVRNLRERIIAAGGEVCFNTQVTRFHFEDDSIVAVELEHAGIQTRVEASHVVLACGHSARDTFEALLDAGIVLEQKPFSVGVRIEHSQEVINQAQYGSAHTNCALGSADYKLSVHLPNKRGVYTFCMCPGGEVVCAASEEESVTVNGMSRFARDAANANSALLVGVNPEDFGSDHPLAGVVFQRSLEREAYELALRNGGAPYQAPAQTVGDFLQGTKGSKSKTVVPSYARGVVWCDLHDCLPRFVSQALEEALPLLNRKLTGFGSAEAVMTGVETRSSSPVRIVRNAYGEAYLQRHVGQGGSKETPGQQEGCSSDALVFFDKEFDTQSGLYPCGEGAGYAGGIMSAACDGVRVALQLIESIERHAQ